MTQYVDRNDQSIQYAFLDVPLENTRAETGTEDRKRSSKRCGSLV